MDITSETTLASGYTKEAGDAKTELAMAFNVGGGHLAKEINPRQQSPASSSI